MFRVRDPQVPNMVYYSLKGASLRLYFRADVYFEIEVPNAST